MQARKIIDVELDDDLEPDHDGPQAERYAKRRAYQPLAESSLDRSGQYVPRFGQFFNDGESAVDFMINMQESYEGYGCDM